MSQVLIFGKEVEQSLRENEMMEIVIEDATVCFVAVTVRPPTRTVPVSCAQTVRSETSSSIKRQAPIRYHRNITVSDAQTMPSPSEPASLPATVPRSDVDEGQRFVK